MIYIHDSDNMASFDVGTPYNVTDHISRISVLRGKLVDNGDCRLGNSALGFPGNPVVIPENGTYRITYLYGACRIKDATGTFLNWNESDAPIVEPVTGGLMYIHNNTTLPFAIYRIAGFDTSGYATIQEAENGEVGEYVDVVLTAGTWYVYYYLAIGGVVRDAEGSVIYHIEKIA